MPVPALGPRGAGSSRQLLPSSAPARQNRKLDSVAETNAGRVVIHAGWGSPTFTSSRLSFGKANLKAPRSPLSGDPEGSLGLRVLVSVFSLVMDVLAAAQGVFVVPHGRTEDETHLWWMLTPALEITGGLTI